MALVVEPRIADLRVTESEITAYLVDGRTVSVPLAWSWRLSEATPNQRDHWELIGDGVCVHWPDFDEDISIEGMLPALGDHLANLLRGEARAHRVA